VPIPGVGSADTINRLSITTFDDNQLNHAVIYYKAMTSGGQKYDGNISLNGSDYTSWTNESYLYLLIANKIGLTITQ
jgi:hypothetical protein